MSRLRSLLAVLALVGAGCADQSPVAPDSSPVVAPLFATGQAGAAQADQYIVVFRPGTPNPRQVTDGLIQAFGGSVLQRYEYALQGFAASLPPAALEGIRRNPNVSFIEADGIATTTGDQTNATWGLDRIDQHALPLSGTYHYDTDGFGVRAYILDTGIRPTHNEFGGRASVAFDAINDGQNGVDCHGHGTHVAGTMGGTTYGVAKNVTLRAVRVLNCQGSGSWSQVIAGIDWVAGNHVKPAVANMSLGGGFSSAVNTAVANAVAAGVTFTISAGNSNADACSQSPASAPTALTIGSTTSSDARSSFSNFGTCVDLFAPGSSITSAWYTSNTATAVLSGTSMASPHVAGVVALYLSANPSASPAQVEAGIESAATPQTVTNPGAGSPNLLLYSLFGGGGSPPPPPPPPPPSGSVHVGNLAGSSSPNGSRNWRATVDVSMHNDTHGSQEGATVTLTWPNGRKVASASCTTDASGTCTISAVVKSQTGTLTFAVGSVSGTGLTYEPGANEMSSVVVVAP